MSEIKKLAGQTLWYGVPTIASRFLGYLMNLSLPFFVAMPEKTADLVQVYTLIPFLNVLYAYGMETAYFRYSQTHDKNKLYSTLSLSMFASTAIFSMLLLLMKDKIVAWTDLQEHSDYVLWMIAIIAVDNLATLPFARLRQENRPKKYAFARIAGIVVNITMVILFVGVIPSYSIHHPDSALLKFYNPNLGIGYYLLGNLMGSLFTLFILSSEISQIRFKFSVKLWKEVMKYSAPLIIVGLGGMVNDVLSRLIYRHVVHSDTANHELGVFANIFRLAMIITIMIQAFRMAAEPFFFNQSKFENAQKTYAKVMKFFVIACSIMFLFIGLYLDIFRWIFTHLANKSWAEGIEIVPLLALGNIFLGIYYNLSVWYKLTNKNSYGAIITIVGAIITIALNIFLIPIWHITGAALATFCCYLFMMVSSYKLGQKHYPIPYAVKKLTAFMTLSVLIYLLHMFLTKVIFPDILWFSITIATVFLFFYLRFVLAIEAKELSKIPALRLFYRKRMA